MSTEDHHKALSKAKIQLMARPDSVFFTTLCFSLKTAFKEDIKTAATNGKSIYFNPQFFMDLTPDERVFLLLHETLHVAYLHMLRKGNFDHQKWNIACDHVINLQLIERGFSMPKQGLADPIYTGMNAEQVYALLPENPEPPPMDDLMSPEGDSEELSGEIQDSLIRAAMQSKMANESIGAIPGDIEIFLNKLLNPKLPWHRILKKEFNAFAKDDYSFQRPNRRFLPDHYLPSLYSKKLIDFAVAIDVSGSVSDADFNTFISETAAIIKQMKPDKVTVIQFDTELKSVDVVKNIRELKDITFTGRGGTRIDPVIAWVNENKVQLLLIFTDGYFRSPKTTTKVKTIWLIHENPKFTAPFGRVIHYDIKS